MRRFDDPAIRDWTPVSRRLIAIDLLGIAVITVIGSALGVLLLQVIDWIGVAVIVGACAFGVSQALLTPRRVAAIGYVLRDDDLVFRRGVLLFRMVAVPYGRMQLVDITRGPLARLFGLAELRLVTAAAASGVTVPGLTEAEATALRDTLVARAESRRVGL